MTLGSEDVRKSIGKWEGFDMGVACRPVYFMLCGLSLELALKAVITLKEPDTKLKGHNLVTLAHKAGIELNTEDRLKLDFLTSSVIWAGRYPVPNNPNDEKLRSYFDLAYQVLTEPADYVKEIKLRHSSDALDWPDFDRIWQSVMAGFYALEDGAASTKS
ncbi:hypothetical protein CTT34_01690 [Vreelandella aquamarina]|uniref:HEPN domain-containing protein n=2 Tax=Vreelandella aquamarina TaxID=77097 RepID=A0A857GGX1_9GAMM|nr:hypothetical protein CTT34_01690 [Halomonas meridiana]